MNSSQLKVSQSQLEGVVTLDGAKNSALRLLAASLLTDETLTLTNYPSGLLDAQVHIEMLEALGKTCTLLNGKEVVIEENQKPVTQLVWDQRSIRNTLLILGALVTRFGEAKVPLPGGCK